MGMRRKTSAVALLISSLLVFAPAQYAQQAPPSQPLPPPAIVQLETEAINWLQGLVRINTTNPPGNELAAANYLKGILDKEGIASDIYDTTPGRGFLVARLSSSPVPDPSKALLLLGHLDVVGVDRGKWTVDPFGGVINGSYLYGRGIVDDKAMTIANLATLIELKRANAHLNRDVIFLAEGDEEAGGAEGMQIAVGKYWDKIAAGFAINQGGDLGIKDGKTQYVGVQVSEKVASNVDVVATGTPGPASLPSKDNPIAHLSAAIAKIAAYQSPVQFDSVTRAYFEALASVQDEDTAKWMRALDTADRGAHAAQIISEQNPIWGAMIRDTISPSILQAGANPNLIPAQAKAVLNIRMLPGDPLDLLVSRLQAAVNDPSVRFEVEPGAEPAPSSSVSSDLYNSITKVAGQEFPGAPVVPYLSPDETDSAFLRERSVETYGLLLFPLSPEDRARTNGNDERIPLDSFRKGVQFLYNIVSDFAVQK
jgi:acetylornithine deacetylase/succinyl-diaminopimelate desuccinylase-like protein